MIPPILHFYPKHISFLFEICLRCSLLESQASTLFILFLAESDKTLLFNVRNALFLCSSDIYKTSFSKNVKSLKTQVSSFLKSLKNDLMLPETNNLKLELYKLHIVPHQEHSIPYEVFNALKTSFSYVYIHLSLFSLLFILLFLFSEKSNLP